MTRDMVLRDMDKCKLCGGIGKNSDFECGIYNGSGEE
jgi:hypothetical protein